MKAIYLAVATILMVFMVSTCSDSSEHNQSEQSMSEETVSIRISSSNPDSVLTFEAIYVGEWEGSAPADTQTTPFEFSVSGTHFYGTFHKLKGNSSMLFTLVGQEDGKTTWQTEREYDHLSQIIFNGDYSSVYGK